MPNRIQELEDFIPPYLHRKPSNPSNPRKASFLEGIEWGILAIIVAIAFIAGLRALHAEVGQIIDYIPSEGMTIEEGKTYWLTTTTPVRHFEEEAVREICANLGRYQNGEEFAEYCAGL